VSKSRVVAIFVDVVLVADFFVAGVTIGVVVVAVVAKGGAILVLTLRVPVPIAVFIRSRVDAFSRTIVATVLRAIDVIVAIRLHVRDTTVLVGVLIVRIAILFAIAK
jgi:hypothetical protein